jgi:hypothetical protein
LVTLSGLKSISLAAPHSARHEIAWSIPPPWVPTYRSDTAHNSANSTFKFSMKQSENFK